MKKFGWFLIVSILIISSVNIFAVQKARAVNPPILVSADINANNFTLTFDDTLDLSRQTAPADITFTGNQTGSCDATDVSISGSTITGTTGCSFTGGEAITVTYVFVTGWIQDISNVSVSSFSNQPVTNNSPDIRSPALTAATVNGSTLHLIYDENLDGNSTPVTSDFSISKNGSSLNISEYSFDAISSSIVSINLNQSAMSTDVFTISYSPGGTQIQDTSGNHASGFSDQSVTNNTPDTTPPSIISADVNGSTLTLTYNEPLDTNSVPFTSQLQVQAGAAITNITISGSTVILTLAAAVVPIDQLTLNYFGSSYPIKDLAGNNAATFNGQVVTNSTPAALASAEVNGDTLTLTYTGNLNSSSIPQTLEFSLNNGSVSNVAISGNIVTLTLANPVHVGDGVFLSYTEISSYTPIRDSLGNAMSDFSNITVTNSTVDTTPPALSSPTVNGTVINLPYGENLDYNSVPASTDFVVKVNGTPVSVDSIAFANDAYVNVTLSTSVISSDTVSITYTPGTNPIRDTSHNNAASLTDQAVSNTTPVDTTAPTLASSYVQGDIVVLTYDEVLSTHSTPATTDYVVKVNGITRAVASFQFSAISLLIYLTNPVLLSDNVTIDYTPGTHPLADPSGNAVASLSNLALSNDTPADTTPPVLTSFTSTTANGTYKAGEIINITAHFDELLHAGSIMNVVLDTGATVTLNSVSGADLSGSYTVASDQHSSDLTVSSIASASVGDGIGNISTSYIVPVAPNNIANTKAIIVNAVVVVSPPSSSSYAPQSSAGGSGSGGGSLSFYQPQTAVPKVDPCSLVGALFNINTGVKCPINSSQNTVPLVPSGQITLPSSSLVLSPVPIYFTYGLSYGTIDPEVKLLQIYLNDNGFYVAKSGSGSPSQETEKFGAGTRAALISFQKAHNIQPAVGLFGAITRAYVNAHP